MKKILSIILAVLMCISSVAMIASCSNKGDTSTENTTPTQTEAPTEVPTEVPTQGEEVTTEEPLPELTPIEEAMAYIHQMYKDSLKDTGNYDLVKAVKIGDQTFTVTWTISGTDQVTIVEKNETLLTVVVPKAEAEFTYTLTASITHEGETVTREYVHTVPKFEIAGFDVYMAAKDGDVVAVEGIVTSISSKSEGDSYNNLYLQDLNGDGGYYIYEIKDGVDPVADLGIKIGMTVSVSGIKAIYNKVHEVKGAVVEIVDSTEKAIDYIDITDIAKAAKNAEADALTNFQGCYVTIKGVEITGQYLAQYYYKWIIGNVDSYTRLSLSSGLEQSVLNEIAAGHTAHTGYLADVKGIVNVYNGAFYLVPLGADAFTYGAMAEVADDVKVEREKNNLTVKNEFTTASKLTLPVVGGTYNTVTIAWTSSNTEVATVAADGKVTFLKAGEVTFTATLTLGTATATATFAVTVTVPSDPAADSTLTIEQALALGASKDHNTYTEGKYYVIGEITEIYNTQYGNMRIKDAAGNILTVYGTYNADGTVGFQDMTDKPAVGDTIKVYGIIGQFNGTPQLKNGWIIGDGNASNPTGPQKPVAGTAYKVEMNQTAAEKVVYLIGGMDGYYMATSTDKSAAIDFFVEETTGGFYLYTMVDGVKTYVNMVVSGTHVNGAYEATPSTVYTYNETLQTLVATVNDAEYAFGTRSDKTYTTIGPVKTEQEPFIVHFVVGGGSDTPVTPPVVDYVTDKDALDALYALESGASATGNYKITGTITALDSYGNPTIVVTGYDNKPVYCYRLTDTRFVVGATVTVTAKQIKNYNGTYEFMDCAVVSIGGSTDPDDPVTPPTPPVTGGAEVKKPVAGTAYKLVMNQVKAGKVVYLDGGVSGYYLSTTEDFASALDFYIEETTGGFYVYTMISGAKKYLNMVVSGTHVNAVYGDTASTVYTYNETIKAMVGVVDGVDYVFGTRNDNTYTTVGANKLSYEPFMVQFVTEAGTPGEGGGSTDPDEPVTPPAPPATEGGTASGVIADIADKLGWTNGTAYNEIALDANITVKAQGTAVGSYSLNTGKYYTSGENWRIYQSESATLTIVAANGLVIKSVKITYNNKNGGTLTFNGANVATGAVVTVNASSVVLGTASTSGATNGQIQITAIEVVYEVGGSQGGGNPGDDDDEEETTTEEVTYYVAEKPVVGTKYNMAMYQGKAKKLVYVNGAMNGYYMNTVTSIGSGVNFYIEETDGGYYLYVMYKGYKFYVNMVVSGTHVNGNYQPTPSTVYTYDEALKTLVATVNGKTYAFGTRSDKTYTTIGPVDVSYNNPFLAQFVLSTNDDVVANEPAGGVIITIEDANTVLNAFPSYGATSYNQFGIKGVVTKVTATSITIKNSNNKTITIKNVYNATGEVALADMEVKPGVGDTIVVMGALTNIGGKAMANGWIMQHTVHTCDMAPATCDEPSTCTICGKTEGEATEDHTWTDATCKAPKTCTVCGATEGEKLADCQGWVDATCSEYGYCTVCGKRGTEYDADAHTSIKPATCIAAAYCEDCDTTIGEKDPTAHGEKTVANCVNPSACKLCGETFGEVSGEHGEIVDCECTVCGATVHTGELSVATCMAPATCGDCGEVAGEKDADNHVGFAPATCIAPATCECGATQGDIDPNAHGELGENCLCPLCEENVHGELGEHCLCPNCNNNIHTWNWSTVKCSKCGDEHGTELTILEAIEVAKAKSHNTYTTKKYTVTGVIKSIYQTTYGNMYIKDADGNEFCIYGTYSVNGSVRFDAMPVKPKVGDTITIYGVVGKYNSTYQIKNGWIVHECDMTDATCKVPATCKICGEVDGDVIDHNYVEGVCSMCGREEGSTVVETVNVEYNMTTIATSTITTTQDFVSGDLTFKLVNNKMAFNKAGQLRVYANQSGVIQSAKAITNIALTGKGNSGTSTLTVKVSNDGSTWVTAGTINFQSTSSTQTLDLGGSYTYVQFVCSGKQAQITKLNLTVVK